ncbi:threonine dehydratase [Herbaspirillum rubrisubalbicans]|uniref:threonine dehydratase n=1 Tax=Herbaspirillum rubrisubalbicans TaxID=80842 RepID=UPI0020A1DC20|nr:threonine dehydratase [Herbaspirillum rubrisubalbicans]MCP1571827.1 threonine dehydratase [Herbaspirillum rubrisubalbicans]
MTANAAIAHAVTRNVQDLLPNLSEIEQAAGIVYAGMASTSQLCWPLLNQALGAEVWVKHENHAPTGAFKVRGGMVYLHHLARQQPQLSGVISATRGNHGQSVGLSARRFGIAATIVVPEGNSREKNVAMRALGVDLIEHGREFQDSREHAQQLAAERQWHMIPSLHRNLVAGGATYWMELFTSQPALDVVLVPVGQGSGICGAVAARNALGLKTRIIGVVSAHALAYKLSFDAGRKIEAPVTTHIADGVACRVPDQAALEVMFAHVDEVVAVTDDEVMDAMKLAFIATHNVVEGAGACALAAALQLRTRLRGKKIGVTFSGGNVDHDVYAQVLARPSALADALLAPAQVHALAATPGRTA